MAKRLQFQKRGGRGGKKTDKKDPPREPPITVLYEDEKMTIHKDKEGRTIITNRKSGQLLRLSTQSGHIYATTHGTTDVMNIVSFMGAAALCF